MNKRVNRILALKGARTFGNTLLPLENAEADTNDNLMPEQFLFYVAATKDVRDASAKCGLDVSNYFAKIGASPALYRAVSAIKESSLRNVYDEKLLSLTLTGLRRSGAGLPAGQRSHLIALENKLTDLGNHFRENLSNDASTITITAAEAASLPDDFVATLKKTSDGSFMVPVNESTAGPFYNGEKNAAARKRYYISYQNRGAPANTAILQSALIVRSQIARLLHYPNWASFVLADRMAQSPNRVFNFLNELDATLMPKARQDIAALRALKASDTVDQNAVLEPWDVSYYNNLLIKKKYTVDSDVVRQYFPVEHTIDRVMNIYHKLLGITFVRNAHPNAWNSEVIAYDVYDTKSKRYIGSAYFDLYPRPGKFGHFANWSLLPIRRLSNGSYRPPFSAILGNWPKPAPGNPALLTHDDVVTFFHEFGHNLAALLATAPYETLSSGFRFDFVEAPSQMLENFMWQPSILKEISANVKTGRPLPDALIHKIIAARYVNNAYFTTRQIMLATVDMDYHTMNPTLDTTTVYARVARETTPMPLLSGIHPQDNFGHLFGYDAGYYGYLWSLVYAQDMFTAFQKGGLENAAVGTRYRQDILQPAKTYEPDVEVQSFLGRPMSPAAFYRQFGVSRPKAAHSANTKNKRNLTN